MFQHSILVLLQNGDREVSEHDEYFTLFPVFKPLSVRTFKKRNIFSTCMVIKVEKKNRKKN